MITCFFNVRVGYKNIGLVTMVNCSAPLHNGVIGPVKPTTGAVSQTEWMRRFLEWDLYPQTRLHESHKVGRRWHLVPRLTCSFRSWVSSTPCDKTQSAQKGLIYIYKAYYLAFLLLPLDFCFRPGFYIPCKITTRVCWFTWLRLSVKFIWFDQWWRCVIAWSVNMVLRSTRECHLVLALQFCASAELQTASCGIKSHRNIADICKGNERGTPFVC